MCIDFNGDTKQGNAPFIKMYGDGGQIILDTKKDRNGYPL
jgi:hypothetical protein